MKKNILFLKFIFIASLLVSFMGCETGLGESVDLTGPTLILTTPSQAREYFSENFTINGTCTDNTAVKTIEVKVGSYEWKGENGKWKYKTKGSEEYVDYANAEWTLDGTTVTWAIKGIDIDDESSVDVIASSVDVYGNTSAESEKKIPIIIDRNPPVATVSSPYIKYGKEESIDFRNAYKSLDDETGYREGNVLREIITGPFNISANMKEDTSVKYVKVYVKKVNVNTGDITDFIEKDLVAFDQKDNVTGFSKPITLTTLSSWKVEINQEDLAILGNGKSYLQISTESCDVANNEDSGVQVHGYVLYWPNASKPWINCNISDDITSPKGVSAGSTISASAQDDEKIIKITTNVYKQKEDKSGFELVPEYANIEKESKGKRVNFDIEYPSDVGVYKVEMFAEDNLANLTDIKTVYINVLDKSYPILRIEEMASPFGDEAGNFTIKVQALDDTGVKSVKYKICKTSDEKTKYSNKDYAGWNTDTSVVTKNSLIQNGTDNTGGIERKIYPVEYPLNLFTDLGFKVGDSAKKLSQATFIFMVEDNNNNKSISKFVTLADTQEPTIEILKVAGNNSNVTELPIFTSDFIVEGTWGDDSYDAWKTNNTSLDYGKPQILVTIREKSVPAENLQINDDGTWIASVPLDFVIDSGSVVGAMDVVASITDIGGSTTTKQKGYQINTDVPSLDYVSCDKINGTYPTGTIIELQLNLTKAVELTGSGTPILTLNNNKSAPYMGLSLDNKALLFRYTVASGDDVEKLLVTEAKLNGRSIKDISNEYVYSQEDLNVAIGNKALNKDIKILTSIPAYKSHSWNDTAKVLTIVFDGLVTVKSGAIEIVQNETDLLVPSYLTKDEYNNMPSTVQDYYEEGTLGASSDFVPNLETKYILKYETNTNNAMLKNLYIGTGAHKVSINIKSEQVSAMQDENAKTTTFTIQVGALPCKGANYTFNIPAGLVKNDAGTVNMAKNTNVISSLGIEEPIIRIYKPQQVISGCGNRSAGTVTHALSTTFKIDCRTPGVTLNYKYDCLTPKVCTVTTRYGTSGNNTNGTWQEEWYMYFTYDDKVYTTRSTSDRYNNKDTIPGGKPTITSTKNDTYSKTSTPYTANSNVALGKYNNADIAYNNGLTYQITATASKTGETAVNAYDVAYRTTMQFSNFQARVYGSDITTKRDYWNYNGNAALFFRGGENYEGANATSGLPSSWDINEKNKAVMLKQDGTAKYYFTTWNISVDTFYYQILGCLVDEKTNTSTDMTDTTKNQGPSASIYMQNGGLVHHLPETPIGKGEYIVYDYENANSYFDIGIPGKVMNHR